VCRFYECEGGDKRTLYTLYIYIIYDKTIYTGASNRVFPVTSPVCDHTRYTIKQRCTTIYRTGFAVDAAVEHLARVVRAIPSKLFLHIPYRILLLSNYDITPTIRLCSTRRRPYTKFSLVSRRGDRHDIPDHRLTPSASVFIICYNIMFASRSSLFVTFRIIVHQSVCFVTGNRPSS